MSWTESFAVSVEEGLSPQHEGVTPTGSLCRDTARIPTGKHRSPVLLLFPPVPEKPQSNQTQHPPHKGEETSQQQIDFSWNLPGDAIKMKGEEINKQRRKE